MSAPTAPPIPAWRRILRWAWLAAVGVALLLVLRRHGADVAVAAAALPPLALALAALAMAAGVGASAMVWRSVIAGLGNPLAWGPAMRVFFLGQIGKYVPGSVWPVLAQMELGRDYAVPGAVSAAAFGLFMLVHLLSAAAVAAVALPAAGLVAWPWALLALPAVALLWPRPLGLAASIATRVVRRPLPDLPDGGAAARAAAWAGVMWLCYGVHLALLTDGMGVDARLVAGTGVFALAWAAGFLFVIAPAGAGAREGVLLALLAGRGPAATLLAVALLSRVLGTLADAGWAGAALLRRRPKRR